MRKIERTSQFKKDVKRYQNNLDKMAKLVEVVAMMQNEVPIPPKMRPHRLIGNYSGCMECHIGSDFLLVWLDEVNDVVRLVRLGSHSELFG